jgi:hypothetical protein
MTARGRHTEFLIKSHFEKGGFRGIYEGLLKSPPAPLFQRVSFKEFRVKNN